MLPTKALQTYETLPDEAQQQVIDFIEFMKSKHKAKQAKVATKDKQKTKGSFQSIHVTRSVSLEEMDDAIAKGAIRQ